MTTPKLVLCTFFACLISAEILSQTDSICVNGTSRFQKVYMGARNDYGYNIAPATDSGYVIVGFTHSFGNGGTDGLITKINKNGNVVTNKAVGGSGDDLLYSVIRTSDGGYIAVGQTKSYGNAAGDAWLVKLDASGNIQWSKKYGDGNVYGDAAYNVTELSDGGYAFAGTHRAAPGVADGLVVRTDSAGNVLWSKSYGNSNSDNASGIVEDGNFLLVAGFYYGASFYDSYVMKLDKFSGALQWIRGFDAENRSTWMSKIAKTNTGYQVVSPVTDNFADQNQQECIWNINTDGSLQNVRKVVISGTWSVSWGWYPLADGGFIGANGENNDQSDALVCRVNANGSLQFSKQYPVSGKQALLSITSTLDGGYALAGYSTNAATIADSNNVCVMKIDSVGGSCSGVNTNAVTVVSPSYSLPTPDVAPTGDVTINNPVITVGVIDSLPITNTVCVTCLSAPKLTITATGANLAAGCNPSLQAIDFALGSASATGGCGTPTISVSTGVIQSNGCFHSQTRTFTAFDTCGNTATTSRTANWIEDVTPPTIVATGNNLNVGCNPDSAAIDAALGSASAIDSCTTPILSTSTSAIQINGCSRSQTRSFTATDSCGNTTMVSRTATWIEDVTPPTITCAGNKTIECNAPVQFDQPTATDNCDSLPTIEVVSTSADGLTRIWQATDACGNTATCSQTITVTACAPHIFPTATTCCNYVSGTAPQLQKVCYSKTGNSISNVTPGVFFYYSYVTAPSSGPFVLTVEQFNNNANFPLFAVQNVSQLRLADLSCSTASIAFTGSITGPNNSQAILTVSSYSPGATYVVSVKYDAKSITGSTVAGTPTATYTFRSKVNGIIAPGSTGTLNAQFGCQDDTPKPPNCQLTTVALPTAEQSNSDPTIRAYPNPFTDIVNFQISATVSGKVILEVYNLQGQKLGTAYEGWMTAGQIKTVQYKSRSSSGALIYQLSISGKKIAGKVFRLK